MYGGDGGGDGGDGGGGGGGDAGGEGGVASDALMRLPLRTRSGQGKSRGSVPLGSPVAPTSTCAGPAEPDALRPATPRFTLASRWMLVLPPSTVRCPAAGLPSAEDVTHHVGGGVGSRVGGGGLGGAEGGGGGGAGGASPSLLSQIASHSCSHCCTRTAGRAVEDGSP